MKNLPSVLITTQCFAPDIGGIESMMTGFAVHLAALGCSVTVLADGREAAVDSELQERGTTVKRFSGLKGLRRKRKAAAATQHIIANPGAILLADSYKSLELLPAVDVRVICLAHGTEFPVAPSPQKASRITASLAKAKLVLANSQFTLGQAEAYLRSDQPRDVFNPPIEQPIASDGAVMSNLRNKLGKGPVIAGVARLEPRKGFDQVLQALLSLSKRSPQIVFALAGSGPDAQRLRDLAQSLGVEQAVRFLGRISEAEKAALLELADIFAMPSRREGNSVEGFGIAYIEAAARNTASLGGIDGGCADAIEDGVTGLLVDGGDPQAVSNGLMRLLTDENLRTRLADAAAIDAANRQWPEQARRFLEMIGNV